MDADLVVALSQVLESEPGVLVAYLFGSRARDDATDASDVDVALLGARPFGALELGSMAERLAAAAGGRAIDLVDLRVAAPLVADEAVRAGRPILVRDELARFDFEQASLRRLLDTRRLRRDQQDLLRAKAASLHGRAS